MKGGPPAPTSARHIAAKHAAGEHTAEEHAAEEHTAGKPASETPWGAALFALPSLLAVLPPGPFRVDTLHKGLVLAADMGERAALAELSERWAEELTFGSFELASALCRRWAAQGKVDFARLLADAEARRAAGTLGEGQARYLEGRCAEAAGALEPASRAYEAIGALKDVPTPLSQAARLRWARIQAAQGRPDRAAQAAHALLPLEGQPLPYRLLAAELALASPQRYRRTAALDVLLELAVAAPSKRTPSAREAALRVAARHADGRRLSAIEADRVAALIRQHSDPVARRLAEERLRAVRDLAPTLGNHPSSGPADAGPADAGPADAGPADATLVGAALTDPAAERHLARARALVAGRPLGARPGAERTASTHTASTHTASTHTAGTHTAGTHRASMHRASKGAAPPREEAGWLALAIVECLTRDRTAEAAEHLRAALDLVPAAGPARAPLLAAATLALRNPATAPAARTLVARLLAEGPSAAPGGYTRVAEALDASEDDRCGEDLATWARRLAMLAKEGDATAALADHLRRAGWQAAHEGARDRAIARLEEAAALYASSAGQRRR